MTDKEWYEIAPYVNGSRAYYESLGPDYEGAEYTVCANVWSEECNEYIEHFEGHTFDNYELANDYWAGWMPDMELVRKAIREYHEEGYSEHYEVEVAVWENGEYANECDFYNEKVEGWR